MEVPKVKKLCNELNQMGVKHLIFTLDNVSLKTFGDSDSIKILGEGQEIQHLVTQELKRAKRVETTGEDENGEVFAASNVKLVAAAHSLKWKGIAQVGVLSVPPVVWIRLER